MSLFRRISLLAVAALAVAAEHFDIGHAMVAESHRLGRLEMGEAGHDGFGMLFSTVEKGGDEAVGRNPPKNAEVPLL